MINALTITIALLLSQLATSSSVDNSIEIVNVFTEPQTVYVGDTFTIGAVIRNSSNHAIQFDDVCYSPLRISINATNIKEANLPTCLAFGKGMLEPNATTVVYSDPSVKYIALAVGHAELKIGFEYSPSCAEECTRYKYAEHTIDILPASKDSLMIKLGIDDTLALDDTILKVVDIRDSRCPLDVVCVIAGKAYTRISIDGIEHELSINDSVQYKDYTIKLLSIDPSPIVSKGQQGNQVLLEVNSSVNIVKGNAKVIGNRLVILVYNNLDKDINRIDLNMINGITIKDVRVKGEYSLNGNEASIHLLEPIKPNRAAVITAYTDGEPFNMQGYEYCCIYNKPLSIIINAYTDTNIKQGFATPISYSIKRS